MKGSEGNLMATKQDDVNALLALADDVLARLTKGGATEAKVTTGSEPMATEIGIRVTLPSALSWR